MLLTDEDHLAIIIMAIRDYIPGETDVAILIVEEVSNQIIKQVNDSFTTQDLYDEIVECFDFYNDFVTEKNIDLKTIDDSIYEFVRQQLNELVEESK